MKISIISSTLKTDGDMVHSTQRAALEKYKLFWVIPREATAVWLPETQSVCQFTQWKLKRDITSKVMNSSYTKTNAFLRLYNLMFVPTTERFPF